MVGGETEQIWHEFRGRLHSFIARRVENKADVEDIVQEVFLRIHHHLRGVRDTDRLSSWVFQITRNVINDYYRSPFWHSELPGGDVVDLEEKERGVGIDTSLPNEEPTVLNHEIAACLHPLLKGLPDEYREALMLVEMQSLTQREAAERLGLSLSGMKSRVQRGRQKLKQMLQVCCQMQFDVLGNIIDYQTREQICQPCQGETSQRCVNS